MDRRARVRPILHRHNSPDRCAQPQRLKYRASRAQSVNGAALLAQSYIACLKARLLIDHSIDV